MSDQTVPLLPRPPEAAPPSDFRLTLRPQPGGVPPDVRLRKALKCLLRSFGLRCVRVEEVPIGPPTPASQATGAVAATPDPGEPSVSP